MFIDEKFEKHDTLNPKLWSASNELLPEVKVKLEEIINQFLTTIDIPINIVDARIVGSQASFNYTENSDLDVHLVSNFELLDASKEIVQALYDAIKAKFNSDYEIRIRGIDVELYVEDIRSTTISNGVYSIYKNKWIRYPKPLTYIPEIDISDDYTEWKDLIYKTVRKGSAESIQSVVDELYLLRKDSLDTAGEYGAGNLLFKEIRNNGLLDILKSAYRKAASKELSLEHLNLNEDSRASLLSRSKRSQKGFQRFKRRVKSRVANSVKQYNSIDMNKLFKDDILTVDINVKGETDDYRVRITFGGFTELLQEQIRKSSEFNLKAVTRALINGFNKDDVYINCNCPDWQYRYAYHATKNEINSGDAELRASDITNPDDSLGSACKHVLLVLSNTSWILKVASTVYNYVNYMQKHYERLYINIIYPAIYGKKYEEPVQLDIFNDSELQTDETTIDSANDYAANKSKFQKGNTSGIRFNTNKDKRQVSLDDSIEEPSEKLD